MPKQIRPLREITPFPILGVGGARASVEESPAIYSLEVLHN